MLRDIEEVAELVSGTQQFKPNCALVITDFLVRQSAPVIMVSSLGKNLWECRKLF